MFGNPENIALEEIRNIINAHLIDGEFFEAKKWGVPELRFDKYVRELDHNWCEFEEVGQSSVEINDKRTIYEFLRDIEGLI